MELYSPLIEFLHFLHLYNCNSKMNSHMLYLVWTLFKVASLYFVFNILQLLHSTNNRWATHEKEPETRSLVVPKLLHTSLSWQDLRHREKEELGDHTDSLMHQQLSCIIRNRWVCIMCLGSPHTVFHHTISVYFQLQLLDIIFQSIWKEGEKWFPNFVT